ncbi:hypothetical protein DFP73DRAFT_540645 [Morchella snyderi]|nr:hypothetical protein DFP73DRAFT_540645 [Morchella snyderi]
MPRCVPCERDFHDEVALNQHQMYSLYHRNKSTLRQIRRQTFANEGIPKDYNSTSGYARRTQTRPKPSYDSAPHSPQPEVKYTCGDCEGNFKSKRDLEHSCNARKRDLTSTDSLTQHGSIQIGHKFPCAFCYPPCGRKFETLEALDIHSRAVEEKNELNIARHTKNRWSIIQETPEAIEKLRSMIHSKKLLERSGYKLEPLTEESISDLRKCINCHEKRFKSKARFNTTCRFHPKKPTKRFNRRTGVREILFPCCGQLEGPDCEKCVVNDQHIYEDFDTFAEKLTFVKTPGPFPGIQKRKAVALDCEMGTSYTNSSELIQLSVVDYFTGESLIDMLVRPKVQLRSFNTQYSGVTREMMAQAIASGEYLDGVEGARNELWKWIDSTTILIGHSLHCDLRELRLAHPLIVDSFLCVPKIKASGNGLKSLMEELLGQKVQDSKSGHDCVEDALASRELVIWCIQNEDRVAERAIVSQKEEEIRRQEREASNILKEERLRLKLEQEQLDGVLESSHSSSAPIRRVGETREHDFSNLQNEYHSQDPDTFWY